MVYMVFISSDAVFSDGIRNPTEKDKVLPESVYGQSKKIGENYVLNANQNHVAIRTTIVGKNINLNKQSFIEWMIFCLKNENQRSLLLKMMCFFLLFHVFSKNCMLGAYKILIENPYNPSHVRLKVRTAV